MQKKTVNWTVDQTISRLEILIEPGVIGFYKSIEITEILGVQGRSFTNLLTLVVAEPGEIDGKSRAPVVLNAGVRHHLSGTEWDIAVVRYRLSLKDFIQKLTEFGKSKTWQPSAMRILTGSLTAVPPQFIPADGRAQHPWNEVLKNNFFEGSHVLELFDTTKSYVRHLLADSRRLSELANIVNRYVPIKVDGMSDRLGNVIIQLPVTVMSTAVRGSAEGEHSVTVAWHPDVAPRNVRVTAEVWQDAAVTSFDSVSLSSGKVALQLYSPGGGARTHIWDDEKRVLLSATSPVAFLTSMNLSISVSGHGNERTVREFLLPNFDGDQITQHVALAKSENQTQTIGSLPEKPREPWQSQRIFSESVINLKMRKELVQYGLKSSTPTESQALADPHRIDESDAAPSDTPEVLSQKHAKRLAALEDIRWLIRHHGVEGVWLWDPFLDAKDILRTLFFCHHAGVPLRALTAGKQPPELAKKLETDGLSEREIQQAARAREDQEKSDQATLLESAKGNCHGLHLEFRIRAGGAGWGFHDRFIIFPRTNGSALAWSLGTSINSFGDEHHVLQKVPHGEPISQAFQDLWDELDGKRYLIWKTPGSGDNVK